MTPALTASLLLVTLAQASDSELFLWGIRGLGDGQPSIEVTITPTPFGLTQGIHIKAVTLAPTRTRTDPRPRSIRPLKTEVTPKWALQAWFTRPARRFTLTVTLSDGTTHRIDPWAPHRTEENKPRQPDTLPTVAPPGVTTFRGE
jgi:hypothetical protein